MCSRFQHFDNSNSNFKELIIGLLDSRATLNLIHCKFVLIQSMLIHVNSKKVTKVTRIHVIIRPLCSSKNKNGRGIFPHEGLDGDGVRRHAACLCSALPE